MSDGDVGMYDASRNVVSWILALTLPDSSITVFPNRATES